LLVGLAVVFVVVSLALGAPQLPSSWPSVPTLADVEVLMRSPDQQQLAGALALLTWAIWLPWSYVFVTAVLRALMLGAERLAAGAAWVRSFRALSDLLTVGLIKRAVDASFAGAMFLRVATTAGMQEQFAVPPSAQLQAYDRPTTFQAMSQPRHPIRTAAPRPPQSTILPRRRATILRRPD
jgi:hypothetical protein